MKTGTSEEEGKITQLKWKCKLDDFLHVTLKELG